MDRTAVARELVAVAKLLTAGDVGRVKKSWWNFRHDVELWWEVPVKLTDPDGWMANEDADYKKEKAEALKTMEPDIRQTKQDLGKLCGGKFREMEWFETESTSEPVVTLAYRLRVKKQDIPDLAEMKSAIGKLGFSGPTR